MGHRRHPVDGRAEDAGLTPDYRLKLNSYDLGVDIELADAIQRIRFEHPSVRVVVITSLKERIFCAGANIMMLRGASHGWKVNFCKFTNETRLAIEDASAHSGIVSRGANGVCAAADTSSHSPATIVLWTMELGGQPAGARRCSPCFRAPAGSRVWSTRDACGATSPTSSAR